MRALGQLEETAEVITSEAAAFTRDAGALRRRLNRFRRAGMLEVSPEITVQQAVSPEDLCQAYTLVHDVFVFQNYIEEQPGKMRLRPYEALPQMATFVAKIKDPETETGSRVVAVMGVVPDTEEFGLPSDRAFRAELDQLRSRGRRLSETTNLAVAPDYRSSGVFFELSRACIAHGINQGYHDSFISISPGHSTFFQAVLGFEPWGDRRDYGDGVVDFVEGMRINLQRFEDRVQQFDLLLGDEAFLYNWFFRDNPHWQTTRRSAFMAQRQFLELDTLRELFVHRTGFLNRCGPEVLEILQQRWGIDRLAALQSEMAVGLAQSAA